MDKNLYPNKMKYIFSRKIKYLDSDVKIISNDLENEVKNIITKPGKDIWLFGGSSLISSLIN